MMQRRVLSLVTALVWVSVIGAGYTAELTTLRYGQNAASTGSLSSLPLTVAERKGFFVREGINLEVVPIPGGTDRIVAALDKGEIDAGKKKCYALPDPGCAQGLQRGRHRRADD